MVKKLVFTIALFVVFIIGSIAGASGFVKTIQVETYPIQFYFDQKLNKATASGVYSNGNSSVPSNFIYQGVTYVPLRFIGESLGKEVGYDSATKSIWVGAKPDLAEPVQTPSVKSSTSDFFGVSVGMSTSELTRLLGKPSRIDKGDLGFDWWVYNKDLTRYLQVGIKGGKIIEVYSNAPGVIFRNIKIGDSKGTVQKAFPMKSPFEYTIGSNIIKIDNNDPERYLTTIDSRPTIFYLDKHKNNTVTAIRVLSEDSLLRGTLFNRTVSYKGKAPDLNKPKLSTSDLALVQSAYEKQVFDITNVYRLRFALSPFTWSETAAVVARSHSKDMYSRNFFDHMNPDGFSLVDRFISRNIQYKVVGENIAYGQNDSIEAVAGWMNSEGHRKNILYLDFKTLGVGVTSNYYTQNFLTP